MDRFHYFFISYQQNKNTHYESSRHRFYRYGRPPPCRFHRPSLGIPAPAIFQSSLIPHSLFPSSLQLA